MDFCVIKGLLYWNVQSIGELKCSISCPNWYKYLKQKVIVHCQPLINKWNIKNRRRWLNIWFGLPLNCCYPGLMFFFPHFFKSSYLFLRFENMRMFKMSNTFLLLESNCIWPHPGTTITVHVPSRTKFSIWIESYLISTNKCSVFLIPTCNIRRSF